LIDDPMAKRQHVENRILVSLRRENQKHDCR
jgi:hypothetical protein